MALSQKHRVALYEFFVPRVGEEVSEALIAEFPGRGGDELVTKDFLRAEVATLRADMAELRSVLLVRLTATLIAVVTVATAIIVAAG